MSGAEETEKLEPVTQTEEETQPRLSMSFFQDLLHLPSCKTIGVCDNCGRCER